MQRDSIRCRRRVRAKIGDSHLQLSLYSTTSAATWSGAVAPEQQHELISGLLGERSPICEFPAVILNASAPKINGWKLVCPFRSGELIHSGFLTGSWVEEHWMMVMLDYQYHHWCVQCLQFHCTNLVNIIYANWLMIERFPWHVITACKSSLHSARLGSGLSSRGGNRKEFSEFNEHLLILEFATILSSLNCQYIH